MHPTEKARSFFVEESDDEEREAPKIVFSLNPNPIFGASPIFLTGELSHCDQGVYLFVQNGLWLDPLLP
jgi:hypothetical protein